MGGPSVKSSLRTGSSAGCNRSAPGLFAVEPRRVSRVDATTAVKSRNPRARVHRVFLKRPLAPIAVVGYIGSFAVPLPWDIPLLLLATLALLIILFDTETQVVSGIRFHAPVLVFLATMMVSTATSVDPGRSLAFSAPFLPAVLLYF